MDQHGQSAVAGRGRGQHVFGVKSVELQLGLSWM